MTLIERRISRAATDRASSSSSSADQSRRGKARRHLQTSITASRRRAPAGRRAPLGERRTVGERTAWAYPIGGSQAAGGQQDVALPRRKRRRSVRERDPFDEGGSRVRCERGTNGEPVRECARVEVSKSLRVDRALRSARANDRRMRSLGGGHPCSARPSRHRRSSCGVRMRTCATPTVTVAFPDVRRAAGVTRELGNDVSSGRYVPAINRLRSRSP